MQTQLLLQLEGFLFRPSKHQKQLNVGHKASACMHLLLNDVVLALSICLVPGLTCVYSTEQLSNRLMPLKEQKRNDYAFRRQINEKPSIILGCPGPHVVANGSCVPNTSSLKCATDWCEYSTDIL